MCSIMGYFSAGADRARFEQGFSATISRGPDDTRILDTGNGLLGFHRLAIMGLSDSGMQPFVRNGSMLVCNGEIYGFRSLREQLEASGIQFVSDSDCEILLPLYERYGTDMFAMLDAEYALILYDAQMTSSAAILHWVDAVVEEGLRMAREKDWSKAVDEAELVHLARRRLTMLLPRAGKENQEAGSAAAPAKEGL